MKIIGFSLIKILSERKEKLEGELKISQNFNLIEISKEKVQISKDEVLKLKFQFSIEYGNKLAEINFTGNIMILPEKDELKKILKSWKDKKLDEEFKIPLFNLIMGKCNIKALNIEEELGLPPHIQMPRISLNQDN